MSSANSANHGRCERSGRGSTGLLTGNVPYLEIGQGPPLEMVQGLTDATSLARHFPVYAVNRKRGLAPGESMLDIAGHPASAIEHDLGQPVFLQGTSTGGRSRCSPPSREGRVVHQPLHSVPRVADALEHRDPDGFVPHAWPRSRPASDRLTAERSSRSAELDGPDCLGHVREPAPGTASALGLHPVGGRGARQRVRLRAVRRVHRPVAAVVPGVVRPPRAGRGGGLAAAHSGGADASQPRRLVSVAHGFEVAGPPDIVSFTVAVNARSLAVIERIGNIPTASSTYTGANRETARVGTRSAACA